MLIIRCPNAIMETMKQIIVCAILLLQYVIVSECLHCVVINDYNYCEYEAKDLAFNQDEIRTQISDKSLSVFFEKSYTIPIVDSGGERLCGNIVNRTRKTFSYQSMEHKSYSKPVDLILNTDNFAQNLRLEICNLTDANCTNHEEITRGMNKKVAKCVQVYSDHNVIIYDNATNHISMRRLNLPTCCKCVLRDTEQDSDDI